MSESSVVVVGKSMRPVGRTLRAIGRGLPDWRTELRAFRAIWPSKTDAELAVRAGISERTCRDILAERAGLSGHALRALLRTEDGLDVLAALMGDARPAWWRRFKRAVQLGALREQLEEQRRQIAEFEREAAEGR